MDAEAERRVARNEAMLRDANEAIERGLWPGEEHRDVRFRCECSRLECNAVVELDLSDYEHVRQQERRFVMREGHERPDIELVVERHPGYIVVEKRGEAGAVAEREDPRD